MYIIYIFQLYIDWSWWWKRRAEIWKGTKTFSEEQQLEGAIQKWKVLWWRKCLNVHEENKCKIDNAYTRNMKKASSPLNSEQQQKHTLRGNVEIHKKVLQDCCLYILGLLRSVYTRFLNSLIVQWEKVFFINTFEDSFCRNLLYLPRKKYIRTK